MHALMHDDRLWACPSCPLGLMYVIRWLYAIKCLGFHFIGGYIKAKPFPSPFSISKIPLSGKTSSIIKDFLPYLDRTFRCSQWPLHDHRLHTLHFLFFFATSFYKKISLLLNVESNIFLLALSFWVSFVSVVVASVVASASVVVIEGLTRRTPRCSLRCYVTMFFLIYFSTSHYT
jgi:hypothetical protein